MADRAFRAFLHPHVASVRDSLALLKLAVKPKLIKHATIVIPTMAQLEHEDEVRLCLHSSLLAADVRAPHASVSFDTDELHFSFTLELNNRWVVRAPFRCGPLWWMMVIFPASTTSLSFWREKAAGRSFSNFCLSFSTAACAPARCLCSLQ